LAAACFIPACFTANVFTGAKENTGQEILDIKEVFWRDITLDRQSL
jgi:hypothetical protein